MAKVGAQRAAVLTGRSKSTVQRAMNSGKLSFEIDPNGRRLVDVSELERCFGLAPQGGDMMEDDGVQSELEKATQALEAERLKMRIRMLEEQLDTATSQVSDLRDQRDQWQKQAQQVLLTSQYSQKQAEEYKEKLEVQQRQSAMRRQQSADLQQRRNAALAQRTAQQNVRRAEPSAAQKAEPAQPAPRRLQSLLNKLRGQTGAAQETTSTVQDETRDAA